jgi:hypothetical protein
MSAPEMPVCPITLAVLKNPWVDPEGNTYEYEAISEWLRRSEFSPITRTPLNIHQLVPNRALQGSIEFATQTEMYYEQKEKARAIAQVAASLTQSKMKPSRSKVVQKARAMDTKKERRSYCRRRWGAKWWEVEQVTKKERLQAAGSALRDSVASNIKY